MAPITDDCSAGFMIAVFNAETVYYRFFAQEPEFMRYVLRELTFYSTGRQAERFQTGREAIITGIVEMTPAAISWSISSP